MPTTEQRLREEQRKRNREQYPRTANIIDSLNKAFGPLKVIEFDEEAAASFEKE